MMDAAAWLYIMANRLNGTIYVGITSDLVSRVYQHRNGLVAGFTKRYGLKRLVYVDTWSRMNPCPRRSYERRT